VSKVAGKTTMLMAIIESIYETMNLRIQETAFELHLRKIYPTRNILSLRETETVSGQEGLDVQKKTDGTVNIIGEVATDPVAAWMIQAAQVASKFTLFTHHAKTFPNLVTALRNSMLRTGVFSNERTAEEQVVQVLNFDIHLVKDFRGRRYIERITECIPIEEKNEYTFDHRNEKTLEGKFDKFFDNATIFFSKTTNKELYRHQNVLEFIDDKYVLSNPISDTNIKEMRLNMNDEDQVAFDNFLERNWGIKPPKMVRYDEEGNEIILTREKTEKVEKTAEKRMKEMAINFSQKMNVEAKKAIGKTPAQINAEIQKKQMQEAKKMEKQAKAEEKAEKKAIKNEIKEAKKEIKSKRVIKNISNQNNDEDDLDSILSKKMNPEKESIIRNSILAGIDFNDKNKKGNDEDTNE